MASSGYSLKFRLSYFYNISPILLKTKINYPLVYSHFLVVRIRQRMQQSIFSNKNLKNTYTFKLPLKQERPLIIIFDQLNYECTCLFGMTKFLGRLVMVNCIHALKPLLTSCFRPITDHNVLPHPFPDIFTIPKNHKTVDRCNSKRFVNTVSNKQMVSSVETIIGIDKSAPIGPTGFRPSVGLNLGVLELSVRRSAVTGGKLFGQALLIRKRTYWNAHRNQPC